MGRQSALILTCEHASNAVPPDVSLGVGPDVLDSHVAWDPGALIAARRLAERFAAPLFAGQVSRLVVDLNRSADRPAVVPERAFGVDIPGNAGLELEERNARINRWHRPFRAIVSGAARAMVGRGARCIHLSVHSYTANMNGQRREYDAGVLFDPAVEGEVALAERLIVTLSTAGVDARPNLPYPGTDDGTTSWLRTRFSGHDYLGLELELCQRLSPSEQAVVVELVAEVLENELAHDR